MLQSAFGILGILLVAWLMSEHRRRLDWRDVVLGLGLQFALAILFLKVPAFRAVFEGLNGLMLWLEEATAAGTSFVFGYLGGGPLPFEEKAPGMSYVLAFRALPLFLVMSALSSLLYYWGVMQVVVRAISWVLTRTLRIGGPVGIGAAANIFVGMVEAPLVVRPYLAAMTRSELFITMTCGMGSIAGTVMVLYAAILRTTLPDALGHILAASLIQAPAAIMVAKVMIPETEHITTGEVQPPVEARSSMDAIMTGACEGATFLIQIVALLVVLVALVALANKFLGLLPEMAGAPVTMQRVLGLVMAPLTWLAGIPWDEARVAGSLMGTKTVLNEFIAYVDLARLPEQALSPRSRLLMVYAMCGFANFGSLGIMIGGMGAMAPERRDEIVGLGMKSIASGTLTTLLTAAVVGCLV